MVHSALWVWELLLVWGFGAWVFWVSGAGVKLWG